MNVFIAVTAVNNETERKRGNYGAFNMVTKTCTEKGWGCLSIDSNNGVPTSYATIDQAFAELQTMGWTLREFSN